MRAKVAQETLIEASGLPYTIVRATQFDEFADGIVAALTEGDVVRVPDARIQPIAAAEVAAHVARAAVGSPVGVVELGGPDKITFAELARVVLARRGEQRSVVVDAGATYFGARVDNDSLVTGDGRRTGDSPLYLISARTVPWVIAAPASTASPVMTPSLWAVTGFSIFMASSTTTRSPVATV